MIIETVSSIPDSTETPAVGSKSPVDDSNRMEVSEDDEVVGLYLI